MSLPEVLIWKRVRGRDAAYYPVRRQHAVGPYIIDFYCSELRLGFEVDGTSHQFGARPEHDALREDYLTRHGIELIRYAARSVLKNPDEVAGWMMDHLRRAPPP